MIELTQQLEKQFGIELYPTLFFEYQNIKELAEYFRTEYEEIFREYFGLELKEEIFGNVSHDPGEREVRKTDNSEITITKDIETANSKDIAIIGMAGIFSDSPDIEAFWKNLRDKKDLIRDIPPDHFDYKPWFDGDAKREDSIYCKWGSFIDRVDKFDAGFFNISPREAEVMDPQLRLLLEVLYATSEDAGYASKIRGTRTGVYVGVCFHDYQQEMTRLGKDVAPHDGTGNAATMMANRPSFYLNLTGPSMAVDTACSSSLVALHLACKALQNKECKMAFAGGANLLLSSRHYRYFCSIGALSHSGRCHTFDKKADGYVPGEGVGVVLLKPLEQAIADHDRIHAVIKGSAVNHGGYTPSITAPSVNLEAHPLTG